MKPVTNTTFQARKPISPFAKFERILKPEGASDQELRNFKNVLLSGPGQTPTVSRVLTEIHTGTKEDVIHPSLGNIIFNKD